MAIVEINRNPSQSELRWFGVILVAFFGVVGLLAVWQFGSLRAARILWGIGLVLGMLHFSIRAIRLPLYLTWMHAVAPIGWAISHLLLAGIFYLLITPIALVMRLLGRDKLERRLDQSLETYWVARDPDTDVARYLRQS